MTEPPGKILCELEACRKQLDHVFAPQFFQAGATHIVEDFHELAQLVKEHWV